MTSSPPSQPTSTIIRIHYEPPDGATLGVRCGESGGDGNDWQKFYYATKKAGTWVCSVPMAKDGIQIEFKPVLQYNASVPPSPQHSKFSFSSPNLRKSFLFSSSSALFQNQSQADFGDMRSSSQPKKNSISIDSNSPNPYNKKNSISIIEARSPATHKNDLMRSVLMSPFRPSAFSVEGERDESYAIGANYITFAGRTIDIYPWFFNWQGSVETIEGVESNILCNKRNVMVYLPPSYNENKLKKYPVLIMQDAHNLFYEHLSFAGRVWKIAFTMDELCASGAIAETIIVALTPVKREYEYLPPTPDGRADGGGADEYLNFIGKELKPMISEKYRITGEYGIAGSSYGGIIALYAWLTRPEEYTKCGCYSPSLRWHKNYMFTVAKEVAERLSSTHSKHLLYLDAGTEGDQVSATCKMARLIEKALLKEAREKAIISHETSGQTRAAEVFDKLIAATGIHSDFGVINIGSVQTVGAVLSSGKLMVNIGQGHNHSEDSWAKRTPLALSFLLRDEQRESRWVNEVVDNISQRILY